MSINKKGIEEKEAESPLNKGISMDLKIFTLLFHFLVVFAKKKCSRRKDFVASGQILIQCSSCILIEQC